MCRIPQLMASPCTRWWLWGLFSILSLKMPIITQEGAVAEYKAKKHHPNMQLLKKIIFWNLTFLFYLCIKSIMINRYL